MSTLSSAGTCPAFGPTLYERQAGKPVVVRSSFSVANVATPAVLRIRNGTDGRLPKVSSALVILNGIAVAQPSDFNQTVSLIDRSVTLQRDNQIQVELKSAPRAGFFLEIDQIDNDPPVVTANASPSANAFGWNIAAVTVSFICSDAICGIATCPEAVTVSTEGAQQKVSGTGIDRAGNQATATIAVSIDKTPPQITATVNPPPYADGWNTSNALVTFNCWDPLSGLATPCPQPIAVSTEGAGQVCSGSVSDRAGNTATATATVNIRVPEGAINGSVNPELIPDTAAYSLLFHAVALPSGVTDRGRARARALLEPAGLNDADVDALIAAANALHTQLRPLEQQASALRESAWPNSDPGTMTQLAALQQQKNQLVEQTKASLPADTAAKLSIYMDGYFKKRIQSVPDATLPPATRPPEN